MSIIEVKNRIKAVKNIGQITKAMEVVAATKMRKSQQVALNSRPYAFKTLQLLSVLARHFNAPTSQVGALKINTELIGVRPVKKTLLIIVTSDRGLAGSFNSQVLRVVGHYYNANLQMYANDANKISVVAVGKKAISYAAKKKLNLVSGFSGFGDFIEPQETSLLTDKLISGYLSGDWDEVITISTHFRSTLKQEVLMRQILPVDLEKIQKTIDEVVPETGKYSEFKQISRLAMSANSAVDYMFEPSPEELIEDLVDHLVRMQIYHIVLEANASEHSARMVAMKTASDNAKELSENLNLEYNKARQANITKELIEITSVVNTLT